jgi:hypothetical protein
MPVRPVLCFVLLTILLSACAEPPSKEMNQAQGAIDAARAAGADQYAAVEFTAATDALRRAEEAVAQRDYRQALSLAIESRDGAQRAARGAGEARARTRGEAESLIAESSTLLAQARIRLREPALNRLPRRALQEARTAVDTAHTSLQEARAAVAEEDYARARKAVDGLAARIQAAIEQIDEAAQNPAARRRR